MGEVLYPWCTHPPRSSSGFYNDESRGQSSRTRAVLAVMNVILKQLRHKLKRVPLRSIFCFVRSLSCALRTITSLYCVVWVTFTLPVDGTVLMHFFISWSWLNAVAYTVNKILQKTWSCTRVREPHPKLSKHWCMSLRQSLVLSGIKCDKQLGAI